MTEVYSKPNDDIPLFLRRGALGKEFHPLALLFPPMNEQEFGELVESVKTNGFYLHEPITLYGGQVLEGRNRALACEAAQVEPIYTNLPDGIDPLQFVLAKNLIRRHLGESQRAMVATKITTMKHGGDRKSDQDANLQVDRATAAMMLNVSERSVASAAKVMSEGVPDLVQAVEQGKVSVSAAAEVAKLPESEQRKVVTGGKVAVKKAAKAVAEPAKKTEISAAPLLDLRFNDPPEAGGRFLEERGVDWVFAALQSVPKLRTALEARYSNPIAQDRLAKQKEQEAKRLAAARAGIATRTASPPVPDEPISPVHASKALLRKYH